MQAIRDRLQGMGGTYHVDGHRVREPHRAGLVGLRGGQPHANLCTQTRGQGELDLSDNALPPSRFSEIKR